MKLYVIRHGETVENRARITQGQLQGTLNNLGKKQATGAAQILSGIKFDQAWASDLRRTVDTADIIIKPHTGLKLQTTTLLREYNFGKYQGKPTNSWHWPKDGHPLDIHITGGESARNVADRVVEFVNSLLLTSSKDTVLIVTHGGPLRILRSLIYKIPLGQIIEVPVAHAEPFVFEANKPLNPANLTW